MVANCACWVDLLDAANGFDAANVGASVRHREARRIISASQTASGLFLLTSPDQSLPATTFKHDKFVSACQYRATPAQNQDDLPLQRHRLYYAGEEGSGDAGAIGELSSISEASSGCDQRLG